MKVVITRAVPNDLVEDELAGYRVTQGPPGIGFSQEALLPVLGDADALVTWGFIRVDAALLDLAPDLKIVANISAGTDNLDIPELTRRGVWATNVPDAFTVATAEVTMALMLSVMRRVTEGERFVRAGQWHASEPGRFDGVTLQGKRLGLIGFGRIAKEVAKRAAAFGMGVGYFARHREAQDVEEALGVSYRPFEILLGESDVVSLHVPHTEMTHHLIGADQLAAMKPTAYLVNTARGKVVDEQALMAALDQGDIAGAGLDVFYNEPSVPEPLMRLPNVAVTPHLGGATREARREAQRLALTNVRLALRGEQPPTPLRTLGNSPRREA